MTDASSTALLKLCGFAPLYTQLIGNQSSRRGEVPDIALRSLNAGSQCGDADFAVFHSENHLVAYANPQRFANLRRNNDPAFLADFTASLNFHMSRLLIQCHKFTMVAQLMASGMMIYVPRPDTRHRNLSGYSGV